MKRNRRRLKQIAMWAFEKLLGLFWNPPEIEQGRLNLEEVS